MLSSPTYPHRVKNRGSQHDGNRRPLRIRASAMEVG